MSARPHVVIIGGGFGGLAAARALARAPADVTLVDRKNHHVFQPLLYQVAAAGLSPAEIASPIRRILRRQANVRVLLADVVAIDPSRKRVRLADSGELDYDFLILAAGATHSYFGHEAWEPHAPGLRRSRTRSDRRRALSLRAGQRSGDAGAPPVAAVRGDRGRADRGRDGRRLRRIARHSLVRDFRPSIRAPRAWC
jgi:NADH dehydrogenase